MILTPKKLPKGQIDRMKACLVVGGHRQDRSLYREQETSSPTIALSTALMAASLQHTEGNTSWLFTTTQHTWTLRWASTRSMCDLAKRSHCCCADWPQNISNSQDRMAPLSWSVAELYTAVLSPRCCSVRNFPRLFIAWDLRRIRMMSVYSRE